MVHCLELAQYLSFHQLAVIEEVDGRKKSLDNCCENVFVPPFTERIFCMTEIKCRVLECINCVLL